jgi:hypothetical protein
MSLAIVLSCERFYFIVLNILFGHVVKIKLALKTYLGK